jgi:hypothetical protein
MNTLTITPVGGSIRGMLTTARGMHKVEVWFYSNGEVYAGLTEMFGQGRQRTFISSNLGKAMELLLNMNEETLQAADA